MPRTEYEYERIHTPVSDQKTLRERGYSPFFSSNVSAGMRDGTDLYIRFHNGSVYQYPNQGKQFNDLLTSPSKGKWVWANLRRTNVAYNKVGTVPLGGDRDLTDEELFDELKRLKIEITYFQFDIPKFTNKGIQGTYQGEINILGAQDAEIRIVQGQDVIEFNDVYGAKPFVDIRIIERKNKPKIMQEFEKKISDKSNVSKVTLLNENKINSERLAKNTEQLLRLSNEYDTRVEEIVLGKVRYPKQMDGAMYNSNVDGHAVIEIKLTNRLKKKIEENSDVNHTFKVTVDEENIDIYTSTHEFAHSIYSFPNKFKGKTTQVRNIDFENEIKEIKTNYSKEMSYYRSVKKEATFYGDSGKDSPEWREADFDEKSTIISDYAMTNNDEFIAEAFTDAKLSSRPSPYSLEVLEAINKYFKRK